MTGRCCTGEEMIDLFSLEGIQSKPAVFDTAKLEWMNGQYLSAYGRPTTCSRR